MKKYTVFAITIIAIISMVLFLDVSNVSAEEADQGQTWEINKEIILSKLSPEDYQKYIKEEGNTLVLTPDQILIAEGGKLIIDQNKEVKTEKKMVITGNLTIENGKLTIAKAGKIILEKQGTLSVIARSRLDNGGSIEIITGEARSDAGLLIDKNVNVNTGNVRLCKSSDEAGYSFTYSKDPIGTQLSFATCFKATSYQLKDAEGQVPIEEDTVLNAGDYTLILKANDETYKSFEAKADLTVDKADIIDKNLSNEYGLGYNEGKKVQDISGLLPEGYVFLEDENYNKMNKYGEEFPIDVGTYKLNVNYAESPSDNPANYNPFLVTVEIKQGTLEYPGNKILSAFEGQSLKDISYQLQNGYAFTMAENTVLGKEGDYPYSVNYKKASSYTNPTLNPANYQEAKVTVKVKKSDGQQLSAAFEKLDINKANIDMTKINTYNDLNNKYNKLSAAEKKKLSVKANNNRNNAAKVIEECRLYPGRNIYYRYGNNTLTLFGSGKVDDLYKTFSIKQGKKQVKGKEFHNKKFPKINTLVVEKGITYLGNGSFSYLPDLTNVVINGDNNNKVTLAASVFFRCDKLKSVKLNGVESVGLACFGRCKKLESVILGTVMGKIGKSAFTECEKLKKVEFPGTVKEIGYAAFSYCYKLQTIITNGKIKNCRKYAFYEAGKKVKKKKRIAYYQKAKPAGKLKKQLTSAGYSIKKKK